MHSTTAPLPRERERETLFIKPTPQNSGPLYRLSCLSTGKSSNSQKLDLLQGVYYSDGHSSLLISNATSTTPCRRNPNLAATPLETSITRPETYGPRSLIRTQVVRLFARLVTFNHVPNGNDLCAAVCAY